jgi:hypothetical protein
MSETSVRIQLTKWRIYNEISRIEGGEVISFAGMKILEVAVAVAMIA